MRPLVKVKAAMFGMPTPPGLTPQFTTKRQLRLEASNRAERYVALEPCAMNTMHIEAKSFKIATPKDVLLDLRQRLSLTRWPVDPDAINVCFEMRELIEAGFLIAPVIG